MTSSVSYRIEDGLVIAEEILNEQELSSVSGTPSDSAGASKTSTSKDDTTSTPRNRFSGVFSSNIVNANDAGSSAVGESEEELSIVDRPTPADIIAPPKAVTSTEKKRRQVGTYSECTDSLYGHPLSVPELQRYFNIKDKKKSVVGGVNLSGENEDECISWEDGGLVWYSTIVPNDFDAQVESGGLSTLKMLPKKYYDEENKCIKPRRPNLAVRQSDFFSSLVKVDLGTGTKNSSEHSFNGDKEKEEEYYAGLNDEDFEVFDNIRIFGINDGTESRDPKNRRQHSTWFFSGVLDGWPALKHLELVQIEYKSTMVPRWRTHWLTDNNPKDLKPTYPKSKTGLTEVRAKLREPEWSAIGWTADSPGYVFWYSGPETTKVPRVLHGANIIRELEKERFEKANRFGRNNRVEPSPKCTKVHLISHRYAVKSERWKDKLTYHSFALLEWDHGKHCTVVELAFLNGLGGYNARCNHLEVRC